MVKRTRRKHSAAFKAKVALAAVAEDKTLAEFFIVSGVTTFKKPPCKP